METNTSSLKKMGYRELGIAGDLLKAYANDKYASDKDKEAFNSLENIEFNPNSGYVFLIDENCQVLMLNNNSKLESWLNCSNCGSEGFRSEVDFIDDNTCKNCKDK